MNIILFFGYFTSVATLLGYALWLFYESHTVRKRERAMHRSSNHF